MFSLCLLQIEPEIRPVKYITSLLVKQSSCMKCRVDDSNAKHIAEGCERQLGKRMQLDATAWAALIPEVWQTSPVVSHER